MKYPSSYPNEQRSGRAWSWLPRNVAAMAVAAAMIGVGLVAGAPAASAVETLSEETASVIDTDRAIVVAKAEAVAMEQQRLAELKDQGLTRDEAEVQLLAELTEAAERGRLRIIELTMRGMTPQAIADAIPGLVLASSSANAVAPMSSNDDMTLYWPNYYFYRQCSCYEFEASWRHQRDLENRAVDVVGIGVGESVTNMGGSISHCDIEPSPDKCYVRGSLDYDRRKGAAHDFKSDNGDRGVIAFSARNYSGCQIFSFYSHAWSDVVVDGVGISSDGFSINYGREEHKWSKRRAGDGHAC